MDNPFFLIGQKIKGGLSHVNKILILYLDSLRALIGLLYLLISFVSHYSIRRLFNQELVVAFKSLRGCFCMPKQFLHVR